MLPPLPPRVATCDTTPVLSPVSPGATCGTPCTVPGPPSALLVLPRGPGSRPPAPGIAPGVCRRPVSPVTPVSLQPPTTLHEVRGLCRPHHPRRGPLLPVRHRDGGCAVWGHRSAGTQCAEALGCRDTGLGDMGSLGHWCLVTLDLWDIKAWGHQSLGMLGRGNRGLGDSRVQECCGLGTLVLRDIGSWGHQGLELWGSGVLGLGTWLLGAVRHAVAHSRVPTAAASVITLCTSSVQCWARTVSSSRERRYGGGHGHGGDL